MVVWLFRKIHRLRTRRSLGLTTVGLLVALAIFGNASTFYYFDRPVNPDITFGDSVWYSVISITTIGYGDLSATSTGARIGTVFFIVLLGLGTFTLLLGMIIDGFTEFARRGQRGLGKIIASDHVIIVNFPNPKRVRHIIAELRSDPQHPKREIVLVTDQIDELPFVEEDVTFVYGSPLETETYERARAKDAKLALVLATSYDEPSSDAVVASAVSVLDRVKGEIHIVAECLHEEHRSLFESVRCDAVVPVLRIGTNLLVQEAADPGIAQMIDEITSNLRGDTLFTTEVLSNSDEDYLTLVTRLLEQEINVLCVNRGPRSITQFRGQHPEKGDRLVYLGRSRVDWNRLRFE